jgi:uncharacterized membrane protein YdbT with pleckstrin-like domain
MGVVTGLSLFDIGAFLIMLAIDLFTFWFLFSPMFGYVELRENTLYIKYGLILKKEIPYQKIRDVYKERKLISEAMMSLKSAVEHVSIKYNTFDVTVVSVVGNDNLIKDIKLRKTNS